MSQGVVPTWDGVQGSAVIVVGQERHRFCLGPLGLKKQAHSQEKHGIIIIIIIPKSQVMICDITTGQKQVKTHDMRTVSGVNQDLVVGVGFPLHLLRAVSSGGLAFATGGKSFHGYVIQTKKKKKRVFVEGEKRKGGSPVRHGRCDVSVVEAGMPRKQDDASVAKHAVEE